MDVNYKFRQKYNPNSIRFKNYDYWCNWFYFVTICTKNRENYFWELEKEKILIIIMK
jgi:hypothetical protein